MKTIFNKGAYQEILGRLDKLSVDDEAKWGKMNITQMLKHCQKPIRLAFGEETVQKPGFFMKIMIRFFKPTLYNEKPWKKGLPTAKEFIIKDAENFEQEKGTLKQLVDRMHDSEDYFKPGRKHPIFGYMKSWMWGQSAYKHLDHHLKQFGA